MTENNRDTITLLKDGTEAFPQILKCIEAAQHSITINMFIWRGDSIGTRIAQAVLDAADRGVKIDITKDRYGISCEYCEEDQTSLFHPYPTAAEIVVIRTLEYLYNRDLYGMEHTGTVHPLALRLRSHPNIQVHCADTRRDHSKFYVFDEEILIFGGINIEDKENGRDRAGRFYRDFMIRMNGREYVRAFHQHRMGTDPHSMFAVNVKHPVRLFEVKDRYLNLIRNAEEELTILMAYFSPVPEFMEAIESAIRRGVRVRLLIPAKANFSSDTNRCTMRTLFLNAKQMGREVSIFLSPDMTHTKYLASEKEICLGSCNITRNAFAELDELNFSHPNDDSPFAVKARKCTEAILQQAVKAETAEDLCFDPIMRRLERFVF